MNNWTIDYGNDQHQGNRKEQQDFFASFEPSMQVVKSKSGFLAVVADGMGGHKGGAQASLIAINTFVKEYQQKKDNETIPEALNRSLIKANVAVFKANMDAGPNADMGTTLVAIVLKFNELYWSSVGDSSLFLLRGNKLDKLNEEHNYGADLDRKVLSGQLSKPQADAESNKRNMLTSYLGIEEIPKIDLQKIPQELVINDKIVVCSDGLVDALIPDEMISCLQSQGSSQDKSELLTKTALNKQRKNQDNITTIVIEIKPEKSNIKISKEPNDDFKKKEKADKKKKMNLYLNSAIILLLIAIVTLSYFIYKKITKQDISQPESEYTQSLTGIKNNIDKPTPEPEKKSKTIKNETLQKGNQQDENQKNKSPEDSSSINNNDPYLYLKTQVVLREIDQYMGLIDNKPGQKTKEALKTFQKIHKLNPTGDLDPKTIKKLEFQFGEYKAKIQKEIKRIESKKNDRNYILKVQCILKHFGKNMYTGDIDNVFGSKTKEGIKALQKARGLEVTGQLNNKTKKLLKEYFTIHKSALKDCINHYNTSIKSISSQKTTENYQNHSLQKNRENSEVLEDLDSEPPVSDEVPVSDEIGKGSVSSAAEDPEDQNLHNTFTEHSPNPDKISPSVKQ
ncbi:Protein phosphatase 2C-related domain protein [Candidatus Magnetomorum sp. HK-1]|nr:Protein phosphatase 2C-related domain protein [Candidatus Magnetomorum sp. HK-1]